MRAILLLLFGALVSPAATYYVTITGLGGAPEYEQQFEKWSTDLDQQLRSTGSDTHVEELKGANATRANIQDLFSRLAAAVMPNDAFAVLLVGHGSFDGTDYKFNIPGPDITASELAEMLNRIPATRQLVVNMTSCSGASVPVLARKNRIVITATKSGNEKNATVFPRYWVDALRDPSADVDKNGVVSVLEAFLYAERKTAAYFEAEKLLATEHASFSDTGSQNAVRDPKPDNGQGLLAAAFPLIRKEQVAVGGISPAKQGLLSRKQELEAKIDRLKYQKAAMPEDDYRKQLTGLLLELARTQSEIDK